MVSKNRTQDYGSFKRVQLHARVKTWCHSVVIGQAGWYCNTYGSEMDVKMNGASQKDEWVWPSGGRCVHHWKGVPLMLISEEWCHLQTVRGDASQLRRRIVNPSQQHISVTSDMFFSESVELYITICPLAITVVIIASCLINLLQAGH